MRTRYQRYLIAAIAISAVLAVATVSHASIQYSFFNITNNGNTDVGSQLSVEVIDDGLGDVDFKFTNNVGTASSITDIYFDDGSLLGISSITDSGAGVDFSALASPSNLPARNGADPDFVTTAGFSADSNPPTSGNGVNSTTEWVTIKFDLLVTKTYADTIAALLDGSLRIGLHVQAIGTTGGSDSYVNINPIPEATSVIVWSLLGMIGVGGRRCRFVKVV